MNQQFQIVPSATGVAVDKQAKASVTSTGAAYSSKTKTITTAANGGIWVKDAKMNLVGSTLTMGA